jgi:hypothetical protein
MSEVTRLLNAADRLSEFRRDPLPARLRRVRRLAASRVVRESPGHTLNPTALVHVAYFKLGIGRTFATKTDYLLAAAEAMRRILVDHARGCNAAKRGAGIASMWNPVTSSSPRRIAASRTLTSPCPDWPSRTNNSPNSCD